MAPPRWSCYLLPLVRAPRSHPSPSRVAYQQQQPTTHTCKLHPNPRRRMLFTMVLAGLNGSLFYRYRKPNTTPTPASNTMSLNLTRACASCVFTSQRPWHGPRAGECLAAGLCGVAASQSPGRTNAPLLPRLCCQFQEKCCTFSPDAAAGNVFVLLLLTCSVSLFLYFVYLSVQVRRQHADKLVAMGAP